MNRARVILALDNSDGRKAMTQIEIAKVLNLSRTSINNIKKSFLESDNIDTFLQRKKREKPPVEAKITGDVEAHIIAVACGEAPTGYARRTCRLIADKTIELGYLDSISAMSVQRVLKKRNFSLIDTNIGASRLSKVRNLGCVIKPFYDIADSTDTVNIWPTPKELSI